MPVPDSCRLSNSMLHQANAIVEVRLSRVVKCLHHPLTRFLSRQVTIGKLSDNVLLNIFGYFLDVSPQYWPRLVHTCRRWRRIVLASQQALHLRLFCTHGTPVLKTLPCWPNLPIIVQYGRISNFDPPAPEDDENIIFALNQSDRVRSITLAVTSSLLGKLFAIKWPFWQLQDLVLQPRNSVPLTLPRAFRWGTRLRCLKLTRIIVPLLLQLLYSSRNLVDLQLHEVFDPQKISPEVLTNTLSRMTQLRSLSLHIPFTTDRNGISPRPRKRVVLPALTSLNFRGNTKYLEDLVARIDAPRLRGIKVTFLNESIFDLSKLTKFIDQIEMHKSHRRADILLSERDISISLTQPGSPTNIKLQVLKQLSDSELLYSMDRICQYFSAVFSNVEDLRISATGQSPASLEISRPTILRSFAGVKRFYVAGNNSTNIMHVLQAPDWRRENVLPSLHKLLVSQPGPHLREAVVSLMVSRRLSGYPITVEYERLCHICEPGGAGTISAQCYCCQHSQSRLK